MNTDEILSLKHVYEMFSEVFGTEFAENFLQSTLVSFQQKERISHDFAERIYKYIKENS